MPPSSPQDRCDPAGTVERILRVDLVDLPFERQLLLAGASRLIVQMRSVQAQEFRLVLIGSSRVSQSMRASRSLLLKHEAHFFKPAQLSAKPPDLGVKLLDLLL